MAEYYLNVCTGCGVSTNEKTCPNGCKSVHDESQPKPTLPWSQVPLVCWECGAQIDPQKRPPHLRVYMGLCINCKAKTLARLN